MRLLRADLFERFYVRDCPSGTARGSLSTAHGPRIFSCDETSPQPLQRKSSGRTHGASRKVWGLLVWHRLVLRGCPRFNERSERRLRQSEPGQALSEAKRHSARTRPTKPFQDRMCTCMHMPGHGLPVTPHALLSPHSRRSSHHMNLSRRPFARAAASRMAVSPFSPSSSARASAS